MDKKLLVIIHDIRSAYNVGAIFRTADGAGVVKIYLSGCTPSPYDPSKDVYLNDGQKMIAKTALGAENTVPWEKVDDIQKLIESLKTEKIRIIGLEKTNGAIDYKKLEFQFPLALILGREVEGIDEKILRRCDAVISIPMRGKKESLNVSVAAGIVIYEILG